MDFLRVFLVVGESLLGQGFLQPVEGLSVGHKLLTWGDY